VENLDALAFIPALFIFLSVSPIPPPGRGHRVPVNVVPENATFSILLGVGSKNFFGKI
jgi:hypothetical protein